jgi:diguanylate cyclase (GGDEF)-like protein
VKVTTADDSTRPARRHSLVPWAVWSALGLMAVAAVISLYYGNPLTMILLVAPAAACAMAVHGYRIERPKQGQLEQLSAALRETDGGTALERGTRQLLSAARRLFRTEYAEILLLPARPGETAMRSAGRGTDERLMRPVRVTDADALAIEAVRVAGLIPLAIPNGPLQADLERVLSARGLRDAMIGVLTAKRDVVGLVIVGDRTGEPPTFSAEDVPMFATFCGHAAVVLENGRLEQSLEELTALKEQLRHQAFHDALTGLPNRVLFTERVAASIDRLRRANEDTGPTVLFLDLDDFKIVNDTWGHAAGDELLVHAAERLRRTVRPSDTPARLGGDEFGVLLDDHEASSGQAAAERISLAFLEPFTVAGHTLPVRPSIGIAISEPGMSTEQLLRNADVAMYTAKSSDANRVALYEAETHEAARRRRQLGLDLDDALARHEIEVHFQPVVSLADGSITAFESLVRWGHPVHGLMSPGDFLFIADNRQTAAIGRRVVREACRHASLWQAAARPHRPIGVWVNLSAVEMASETLVRDVVEILEASSLDPTLLTLEITEHSVIMGEEAAIERMGALRKLGVKVAIDDFGTGYSSLSRLGDFPLDMLKIPKPFVDKLVDDAADQSLVDAILRLAGSLGLDTVAEGVERAAQAEILLELGCPLAQGFLYAPALDGDFVGRLLGSGMKLPAEHGFRTMTLARPSNTSRRVA